MTISLFKTVLLSALALGGVAHAADGGGYLLLGGGTSKFNDSCAGTSTCDTTGNSVRVVGGYRLGNGLAVEVVGLDFGKAKATSGGIGVELKANAIGAGVAMNLDLSPSWLFSARLGVAQVKVKAKGTLGAISVTDSESSTTAYAGLGIGYRFTDTVSLELAYDTTRAKYGGESENVSATTINLGIRF